MRINWSVVGAFFAALAMWWSGFRLYVALVHPLVLQIIGRM